MASLLHMITFRCDAELFERLERFSIERNIDRTSVLKLALHYYLNRRGELEVLNASASEKSPH